MKPRIYILSILFVAAMLFTSQVKADGYNNKNNNNNSNCNDMNLPIDSGITFLVVAGVAIGIFAVSKSKATAKMAAIKS